MKQKQLIGSVLWAFVCVWLVGCQQAGAVSSGEGGTTSTASSNGAVAPPDDEPAERSGRVLRVGVSRTAPPLIFEKDGKEAGIEADFARELAKALDRECEFVPVYWPDLLFELQHERIDIIMAGMTITAERELRVRFTEPYLVTGLKPLVREESVKAFPDADSVMRARVRIGVEEESVGAEFVRTKIPGATVVVYPTVQQAVDGLVAGRCDIVVHDAPTVQWMAAQRPKLKLRPVPGLLTKESLAWAVNRNNEALLEDANRVLAEWKRTGKLGAMLERWLGKPGEGEEKQGGD